jgi:protease-4
MTPTSADKGGFATTVRRGLRDFGRKVRIGWAHARVNIHNWRRRKARLDYIIMPLSGSFPEREGPPPSRWQRWLPLPLPTPSLSVQALNRRLQLIAEADNVQGVVFLLRNLDAGLGTLQNVRRAIERLRAAGKEVVVHTPFLDMRHFYIATAADRIIAPPSAKFDAVGLYTEVTFLKDTLARAGIGVDVIQISPYKTAFDRFGQSDLTPEYREQLSWLLDEQYDILTGAMAEGRNMTQGQLQALIDLSPMTVEAALSSGLIDDIAYDDELPLLLAPAPAGAAPAGATSPDAAAPVKPSEPPRAKMKVWSEARSLLHNIYHRPTRQYIGVISLEGAINMGTSRTSPIDLPIPLIGGGTAIGEQTAVRVLRQMEKQRDMAAVILHVDSGGGSALASDLIGRQVALLAQKKPVLVYMGNIAASGGYYIAAPAQHIMSQTSTITGSIGVIMAHVTTTGLLDQLSVNKTAMHRGNHAGLYQNTDPLSEQTRALYWQEIVHTYEQFKAVVAAGRELPPESLDPVCQGRVWTGRQAREHRLVDSHGDFLDAIRQAAEMGNLPTDDIYGVSVANIFPRSSSYVLPANGPAAWMGQVAELLAGERLHEWTDRPLALLPFEIRFR